MLEYPILKDMAYLDRYIEIVPDFNSFIAIQEKPLGYSARINTLKISKSHLLDLLYDQKIDYSTISWYNLGLKFGSRSPGKLLENLLGYIHIQEELSMVPPLVLDPQPGETILDLCASPGSKTTQISQMMNNQGLLIANEPSFTRIAPLRSNCERLGVSNVAITRYDGCVFPSGTFDRVLVDAPCSSEGRARLVPSILARSSSKASRFFQVLQVKLLKNALRLAKPGGVVVYSTCTYAPEENELVVERFLDIARLEKTSFPGLKDCDGIERWDSRWLNVELRKCSRYYPHQNDTGGFFVAKLRKNQE